MLRITPSRSADGAKQYFNDALSRGDYYLEGQELAGSWGGIGASKIGLEGEVTREAFHQLCDNINPATGDRLTGRNHAKRRVGMDFNFHCPKLVSYMQTKDERIMDAFLSSVRETMQELERDCQGRVGGEGAFVTETTGNMLWGEFVHLTSRPVDGVPDPHLHAHCFAMNATYDEKRDMWKAADFGGIKRDGRYFEAAFHARLSGRMAAMGYEIKRDDKGYWDIASIPSSVRDKFSRRSAEIDELAKELGIVDPKALDELGAKSREAKTKGTSMADLRETWDSWLTPEERAAIDETQSDADGTPRLPEITTREAVDYAKEHLFSRRSVVPKRSLAEETLRRSFGKVSVEDAWSSIARQEQTGTVLTGRHKGRDMATTRQVLAEEREMIAFAREGRGACSSLGRSDYVLKDPLFSDPKKDTAEQEAAIRSVLGSHDRVIDIRGGAGTGKTTVMPEIAQGIAEGGHQIHAFAPTADASRGVQRREGFKDADTVARLLMDHRLQQQVRGQVLWIDEAGLLGAQDTNRLFKLAKAQGCRVILTGDTKQHTSVARGDALRILEEQGGVEPIEITKIQRQRVHTGPEPKEITQYRHAVKALSEGDAKDGFEKLDQMGAVHEFDINVSPEERYAQIAEDYLQAMSERNLKGKLNNVLAVSPTHAEANAVTGQIRDGLKQAGKLGEEHHETTRLFNLGWTDAQLADTAKYKAGQIVQFHQNVKGGITRGDRFTVLDVEGTTVRITGKDGGSRTLPLDAAEHFSVYEERRLELAKGDRLRITQNGFTEDRKRLNNGAIYTVDGFTSDGNIRLNNGWEVSKDYGHMAHGYVTTSNVSQGKTVDRVLIAQSGVSLTASSLEQFYVSVSRGKEQVHIYTDDKDALGSAIRRSGQRVSATELVEGKPDDDTHKRRRRNRQFRQIVRRRQRSIRRGINREQIMDRGQ